MCKHILFNNFTENDLDTLALFATKTYDRDGFGAIVRLENGRIETLKSLNESDFYIRLMRLNYRERIKDLVVHHRTSTNGDGLDYAHPFEFQGHYLTHNGVVTVPGDHETKTKNDSEALLHHLIKTNYGTESISGYFSCFILNENSTTILVDATAPIYTDGRVYSSHKMNDDWTKRELVRILLPTEGGEFKTDIKVTKTDYGLDKSHLSLGSPVKWEWGDDIDHVATGYFTQEPKVERNADLFFECLTPSEERMLARCKSLKSAKDLIRRLASEMRIALSNRELKEILKYTYGF